MYKDEGKIVETVKLLVAAEEVAQIFGLHLGDIGIRVI
jgi:hypothetical protein